jgi:hypothetical protein
MFASSVVINLTNQMIAYWSYNGTSETSIMDYWTIPMLGPDGGTALPDLWKLGAQFDKRVKN